MHKRTLTEWTHGKLKKDNDRSTLDTLYCENKVKKIVKIVPKLNLLKFLKDI
jgi:hypothetical protein